MFQQTLQWARQHVSRQYIRNTGFKSKSPPGKNNEDSLINDVIYIIEYVSYSKGKVPSSIEGKIVQDADRLDALGAIGIARTFAYGGNNNRLIYNPGSKDDSDSIYHFYDKLFKLTDLMNTDNARSIAVKRTKLMKDYLDSFYK